MRYFLGSSLLDFFRRCLPLVLTTLSEYGANAQECKSAYGTHISVDHCRIAIHKLLYPLEAGLNPTEAALERPFSIYSQVELLRMPRGITEGTCALAIDIHGDGIANANWQQLRYILYTLVTTCVEQGGQGLGGKWELHSGFVFLVVNPYTVNVAKTCMAPWGPRRMTVVDCVDRQLQQQPPPGPSNQGAHPTQLDLEPLPLRSDYLTQPEEPMDDDLLSLVLPDDASASTENKPSPVGIGPSISGQPRIISAMPRRLNNGRDRIEITVGARKCVVREYWLLEDGVWISHYGRSAWKSTGKWILILGRCNPTRFPTTLPVWPGGEVWTPFGSKLSGMRRHPLSEAWIAEDGVWRPLQGMVPPDSRWIDHGGWILLKGNSQRVDERYLPPM